MPLVLIGIGYGIGNLGIALNCRLNRKRTDALRSVAVCAPDNSLSTVVIAKPHHRVVDLDCAERGRNAHFTKRTRHNVKWESVCRVLIYDERFRPPEPYFQVVYEKRKHVIAEY